MKKNEKILIGGGIAALLVGAIIGAYFYTKKVIQKIAAGLETEVFELTEEQTLPQEDNEQKNIKTLKLTPCVSEIRQPSIEEIVDNMLKDKFINYLDDKYYIDHINTINLFDGDDRK